MPEIDVRRVASTLTSRFGLEILPSRAELDGGSWLVVRPSSPAEPNGFAFVLARTPRSALAIFRPDRFSGELMRSMSEADEPARRACVALLEAAHKSSITARVSLDEEVQISPECMLQPWRKLELECEKRWTGKIYDVDAVVVEVASAALSIILALLPLEDETNANDLGLPEGARSVAIVNRYERSPANRAACIAFHGAFCAACGFDFAREYGSIGDGYIEVHHTTPVSMMGGAYRVDPIHDLVPLCANCHAIAHRRTPPLEVSEIRRLRLRESQRVSDPGSLTLGSKN